MEIRLKLSRLPGSEDGGTLTDSLRLGAAEHSMGRPGKSRSLCQAQP